MRSLTPENARRVAEDYLTVLRDLGPDAARVTDKMPPNFMWIGLIHLIFPKARIIHCKRNPIDTCLSIYFDLFHRADGLRRRSRRPGVLLPAVRAADGALAQVLPPERLLRDRV